MRTGVELCKYFHSLPMRNRLAQSCSPARQWVGNSYKHFNPAPVLLPVLALNSKGRGGRVGMKGWLLARIYLTVRNRTMAPACHAALFIMCQRWRCLCIASLPFLGLFAAVPWLWMCADSLPSLPSCPTSRVSPSRSSALANSPETHPPSLVGAPCWRGAEQKDARRSMDN